MDLPPRPQLPPQLRAQLPRHIAIQKLPPDQAAAFLDVLADFLQSQLTDLGLTVHTERDKTGVTIRLEPPRG